MAYLRYYRGIYLDELRRISSGWPISRPHSDPGTSQVRKSSKLSAAKIDRNRRAIKRQRKKNKLSVFIVQGNITILRFAYSWVLGYESDKFCSLPGNWSFIVNIHWVDCTSNVMALTHIKCSCFAAVLRRGSLCDIKWLRQYFWLFLTYHKTHPL
jgi:hypothetical protein